MLDSDDTKPLSELMHFLRAKDWPFIKTELPLILPAGARGAYALDGGGRVVGLKFAGVSDTKELLERIPAFRHLERLVYVAGQEVEIPSSIGMLRNLHFLWLSRLVIRIPPEILELNLPVFLADSRMGRRSISLHSDAGEMLSSLERLSAMLQAEIGSNRVRLRSQVEKPHTAPLGIGKQYEDADVESWLVSRGWTISLEKERYFEQSLKLRGIFLSNVESLVDPPIEIVSKGREAIASYFRDRKADPRPLNELKVLFVGEGSSGKTSLVKGVFGEPFDPAEPQTHGISIRSIRLESQKLGKVKANFWDFGGQEIMHATHQFFLSKRSLYVLVLDGRKDQDPEYWLQHIASFGGDSPVMIVLNKIDEHHGFDVNRRFLTTKYPSIIDFYRVSCATGEGVTEFKRSLKSHLDRVSILQTSWPRNWFKVKLRLENLDSAYISFSQYTEICERDGIFDQASQDALVDFLHDLEVILHFRDLQLLDTHVLDPRWVTEAVYRIINSDILAMQKGVLRLEQLKNALAPCRGGTVVYAADKYTYIIELMLKFELCYKVDGNAILIPDLLDIQEPEVDFDYDGALRFVFEYRYLPKSVMPRFMVRLHKDIRKGMRWRTGVVLEDKSFKSAALIRVDETDKKIYVFVNGKQKRDYFSHIRKVISDINASFEKLEVTELVPLPGAQMISLDYKELIGYEQGGRPEIFVGRLGKGFSVQALLNGLEERETRLAQAGSTIINNYNAPAVVPQGGGGVMVDQRQEKQAHYSPQGWGKIATYIAAIFFIGVVSFLAIRNQPIADRNIVVFLRVLLSLAVAVIGASVPGLLRVDFTSKRGLLIRSSGALALFVLSFIFTPKVL